MPNPKQPLHNIRFPVTSAYRAWLEDIAGDIALTDYIARAVAEKAARDRMPAPPQRTNSASGVRVDYRQRQQAAIVAARTIGQLTESACPNCGGDDLAFPESGGAVCADCGQQRVPPKD